MSMVREWGTAEHAGGKLMGGKKDPEEKRLSSRRMKEAKKASPSFLPSPQFLAAGRPGLRDPP